VHVSIQRVRFRYSGGSIGDDRSRLFLNANCFGGEGYYVNTVDSNPTPLKVGPANGTYLDDRKTSPGEKRVFNPCYHEQTDYALVMNKRILTYTGMSHPDMYQEFYGPHVGFQAPVSFWNGFDPVPWSSLYADLAAKLNGSVQCGSMIAVTACEAAKTIAMVRNPFNLLKPNWRSIAGKSPLSRLVSKASNVWLEGLYGWKATANDVRTAAKTVSALSRYRSSDPSEGLETRLSFRNVQTVSGDQWLYPNGWSSADWPWSSGDIRQNNVPGGKTQVRLLLSDRIQTSSVACRQINGIAKRFDRTMQVLDAFAFTGASILDVLWEIAQ